ncbi:hypothetical protein RBG61_06475 [Paludicola sp. MB14-C6]|uniref:hypothetical protein n=1 Tax=Paludihabitans sp. MB14-C6 TaxID=3070656 RepID=UPI0027DE4029|nr:hypothetical protein [Paludicola sp. MB14-C6]WMJ24306.1 hypothetical protein RBG61_06475 [Paludicola sp. MB14-C6]
MIAFITTPEMVTMLTQNIDETYELVPDMMDIRAVVSRFKNIRHYSNIIIDLNVLENSDDEITSQLYLLKAMNDTNIIIIAQGKSHGNTLLSELVKNGFYNFVLSYDEKHMLQEFNECLNHICFDKVKQYVIEEPQQQKKGIFTKKKTTPVVKQVTTIGVVGVLPRIGTTTQAIRIVKSLINSNIHSCYVERNQSNHISFISNVFSEACEEQPGLVTYKNVPMYYEDPTNSDSYEYIIYDYGAVSEEVLQKLSTCDIKIIGAGTTAWEMTALAPLLNQYDNSFYLFSFTDKKEEQDLLDFMESNWTSSFICEFVPDMFSDLSDDEKKIYHKLIQTAKKITLI